MLTAHDVTQLETALWALLTPLDHDDLASWRRAVSESLCRLLDGDNASTLMPAPENTGRWHISHLDGDVADEYERRYAAHDAATERMLALKLGIAHTFMLWSPDELRRSEVYHDYIVPARLYDGVGLRVRGPDGALAGLCVHRERPRDSAVPERSLALLRAVAPAFQAGVATWVRLGAVRAELPALVDSMPGALLVCDAQGRLLHANAALERLLGGEPERARLEAELHSLAASLCARRPGTGHAAPDPASRVVRTARRAYRMHGSFTTAFTGAGAGVVVTVEPVEPTLPDGAALRTRFGLTAREVAIAGLLADGRANKEIAAQLGISPYTARNHTERVLGKLGVPSRARVGALLRELVH